MRSQQHHASRHAAAGREGSSPSVAARWSGWSTFRWRKSRTSASPRSIAERSSATSRSSVLVDVPEIALVDDGDRPDMGRVDRPVPELARERDPLEAREQHRLEPAVAPHGEDVGRLDLRLGLDHRTVVVGVRRDARHEQRKPFVPQCLQLVEACEPRPPGRPVRRGGSPSEPTRGLGALARGHAVVLDALRERLQPSARAPRWSTRGRPTVRAGPPRERLSSRRTRESET